MLLAGRWSQADALICATFDLHAPTRRFTALATRVAQCWALLAAARLGDTDLVIRLRDQLLPYRRLACAASVNMISGSVAYFTAEAALALGDPDAALADLAIAVETDEAMGALPWLARARDATSRAQTALLSRSPARPKV